MGIGLVMAGFILLFNPVVIVVDVIPDAVGFFLIAAGLTKMSCFIGKIEEARQTFLKLAFVETAKIFSIVILPYASGSANVLLAFVFGLIEGFLFVPAVANLFEGLSFAALWYGGTAVYAKKETVRGGKAKTVELASATKRYILFFYLFRIVATLVPELTELQMYDNIGTVDARIMRMTAFKPLLYILFGTVDARMLSLTEFKPLLYIFFTLIVLIFGAIYIARVVRYFGPIRRDKPFLDAMERKYTADILPKTTFFIAKNMKVALMLFGFSAG
ncbi:MAG: hypothetical protein IKX19_01790, partial [Clostridia bacterium]|nr:hypothetical protein [Clostridia bacterium]